MFFDKRFLITIIAILILAACSASPKAQPTIAPGVEATAAPAATVSPTTLPATEAPAPTSLPTATKEPRPPAITVDNAPQLQQVAVQDFKYDKGGVYGLAWAPDLPAQAGGQTLAVSSKIPKGITLYDQSLTPKQFISTTAVMYTPAFNSDGTLLAAGGSDNVVRVWKVADGSLVYELKGHTSPAWANVVFSSEDNTLASGGMDKTARLWPLSGGEPTVLQHTQAVGSLAFSPSGQVLASSTQDAVHLWNVADGKPVGMLQLQADSAPQVYFLDDNTILTTNPLSLWQLSASGDGTLAGKVTRTLPYENISACAVSPDRTLLALGGEGWSSLRLVNLSTGETVHEIALDGETPVGLAFSPGGAWLAVATDRAQTGLGAMRVWGIAQGGSQSTTYRLEGGSLVGD